MSLNIALSLPENQTHYLKNVLRKSEGDQVRFFNARDGEWLGEITKTHKKSIDLVIKEQIATQPEGEKEVHLYFAPLKKNRMDILIEKAVELGVTHLHPIITARTEVRKINEERVVAQILEAAEQCERFFIPTLLPIRPVTKALAGAQNDIFICLERASDTHIDSKHFESGCGFVIGPAGGFEEEEIDTLLKQQNIKPLSLGATIYRAETAAIVCLVHAGRGSR